MRSPVSGHGQPSKDMQVQSGESAQENAESIPDNGLSQNSIKSESYDSLKATEIWAQV